MGDFGYAFNNIDFSDRVLRIEIASSGDWKKSCVTWLKSLKRRFSCNHATLAGYTAIGDHGTDHDSDDQSCSNSRAVKVRTLNISSPIVASQSPFFYELFEESPKKEVTLRIEASEEAAVMDLLNYMYINTLSATRAADLLSVLAVAIKFEVASCIRYCNDVLQKLPKPPKYDVLICPKPSRVRLMGEEEIQPLKDAAKKCLADHYRDFTKRKENAMSLPLSALEVVLGSGGLEVDSEDDVFYFILKWADAHSPGRIEAREIVINRLLRFIRVPYLTLHTIQDMYVICWFGRQGKYPNMVSFPLLQAIHVNAGFGQCNGVAQDPQLSNKALIVERVYTYHPVKVVSYFDYYYDLCPPRRCAVYFFLTRQDMDNLFRSKRQYSKSFYLRDNGHRKGPDGGFYLLAKCNKADNHLGLYVVLGKDMPPCTLDYEFAVLMKKKKKPLEEEEYQTMCKVHACNLSKDKDMDGKENLFGIPWTQLMAEDSEYFIDGMLHLRAHLILNKNSKA